MPEQRGMKDLDGPQMVTDAGKFASSREARINIVLSAFVTNALIRDGGFVNHVALEDADEFVLMRAEYVGQRFQIKIELEPEGEPHDEQAE